LKRVPSFLDDAISAAQKRLGIDNKPVENKRKTDTRPSLLELNYKSKPRVSLPIHSHHKKSWLIKNDDELSFKENNLSKKTTRGPIWKVALDELNKNEHDTTDLTFNEVNSTNWPPVLSSNISKTMDSWHVVEENRQLTKTIEAVIKRPGSHLNPIHIKGTPGVGKTHISLATGYEIQSLYGNESVRIIRSSTLADNSNELPTLAQNILNLKMIIIEDFEELENNLSRMQALSNWLIWNINNGIQIIITSNGTINLEQQSGDTKRLLESSIMFNINEYTNTSKMRILRRIGNERNVILSDEHLSILVSTKKNLPSLLSAFEKFVIAQKDGTLSANPEEAIANLDGVKTLYNTMFSEDIINSAKDIASKTIESTEIKDFDLNSDSIELNLDLDLDLENLPELNELHSKSNEIIEEDNQIISKWNENLNLPTKEVESSELLGELSGHGLERMVDVGMAFEKYNDILENIESRITDISKTLEDSDTETLLQLADEMSDLEYSLQDLKPLISVLDKESFTIEPEKEIDLPNLDKLKELDEYIPNNEWNLDSEKIEMEDLLDGELNPVNYPVLIPTNNAKLQEEE
tara:strand:- start:1660 stop:3399 length:1740 start_codon:yes stop_codon:yes gene_type:complete